MKTINKNTLIIALLTLVAGIAIGYLLFGGGSKQRIDHDHQITESEETYTCSMHPQIRQNEPGDCPICGMELVPVDVGEDMGENLLEIRMTPTAMQLANVQTAVIRKEKPVKELRLSGKMQPDERYVYSQTSHISGRIEKLLITYTGEYISKGQVIAYVYSPELVTAQDELFEALKIRETHPGLFNAAREKLKNWKLTDKQIDVILETGTPTESFPILSDLDGVVTSKRVNLGDHIMQGTSLFEVANLSKIWVLFDIYESDLSWVKIGSDVEYEIQSIPGRKFNGKISFIDPVINPKTRVAKARINVSNKSGLFKPEMFVTGLLKSPLTTKGESMIVPKSAVLWTGERSVVYVKSSEENGVNFSMRQVVLGTALGDYFLLKEGLEEGEEIAVNGAFSIDAAAQLAGKPSMMNPAGNIKTKTKYPEGHAMKDPGNRSVKAELDPLFISYIKLKNDLVHDDFEKAISSGNKFRKELEKVNTSIFRNGKEEVWRTISASSNRSINKFLGSEDIRTARSVFIELSEQMITLAKSFKPGDHTLFVLYCPMVNDNKGASWLSDEKEIFNPYFGEEMLRCGSVKEEL